MIRNSLMILALVFVAACNNNDSNGLPTIVKDSVDADDSVEVPATAKDNMLLTASSKALRAIKERNYTALSEMISVDRGLRLSPYGFVDTVTDIKFSPASIMEASTSGKKAVDFIEDGSGKKMSMTLSEYFDRYVYDKDFIRADKKAINHVLSGGNSLNNLSDIFPGSDFMEYYMPGTDPKYGGMDWKSLRLVFVNAATDPRLVAIVHDEWTP